MRLTKVLKKKKRLKKIKCLYPECGKDFWGHPVRKYCRFHRNIKNRIAVKKEIVKAIDCNMTIKHEHLEPVETEAKCDLKGCKQKYKIMLLPKLFIYPRFCEEHRNEFRRKLFLKEQN